MSSLQNVIKTLYNSVEKKLSLPQGWKVSLTLNWGMPTKEAHNVGFLLNCVPLITSWFFLK